ELTAADFRCIARQPGTIFFATVGQAVLLPLLGWLLVRHLPLQPDIAHGTLLVTACPSGAMANLCTSLGRGNVALSVTLTAVSCLTAVLATPGALAVLPPGVGGAVAFGVPLPVPARPLAVLLVLPVLVGMGIRQRWPDVPCATEAPCLASASLAWSDFWRSSSLRTPRSLPLPWPTLRRRPAC